MYIPTGFFGTGNQLIASGGVETLWISGSIRYKSHEFRGTNGIPSGTFQVLSGNTSIAEILVVGGGGLKGFNNKVGTNTFLGGGAGGGGFIYSSSITLEGGSSYGVSTGTPNANFSGSSGNPSQISGSNLYISASGGGGGANGSLTTGKNGGSGGGGGTISGAGTAGQGNSGGIRAAYVTADETFYYGGGGGGAATAGGNATSTNNGGGRGGEGRISRILNGTTQWYSGGGGGVVSSAAGGNGGSGSYRWPEFTLQGENAALIAAGQGGPGSGGTLDFTQPGAVIIKYPYQAVNVNNCDCFQFLVTGSATTGSLMSYVQGGTGNFVEGQALAPNTTTYISVVSGSQSQTWNWNRNVFGLTATYSFAYSGFCTSSI